MTAKDDIARWSPLRKGSSWNCAHLANGTIRLKLQRLNTLRGRHLPVIVTPEELMPESDT